MWRCPYKNRDRRYESLAVEQRICPFYSNIEVEMHVIRDCSVYNDLRVTLLDKASDICHGFNDLYNLKKLKILFSERRSIVFCAKTCFNILQRRYSPLLR